SYQLATLDSFAGAGDTAREARRAWRALQSSRRIHDELTRDAVAARERLEGLAALVADTEGLVAGREEELRAERELLRHVAELATGSAAAIAALAGDEDSGAADLTAQAERAVAPLERLAPELA